MPCSGFLPCVNTGTYTSGSTNVFKNSCDNFGAVLVPRAPLEVPLKILDAQVGYCSTDSIDVEIHGANCNVAL
jgi:hypothetical protein